ncbi:cupin domain-containing protein [uncultured Shimia sp.]|uniref:cupin domain-containing protein n=1 Tax=uncultured Shimia sp. TaxID=573152 RepID=UPI0025EDA8E5|nr:cupin domain-containing protein [uncultured Shimia sp.]
MPKLDLSQIASFSRCSYPGKLADGFEGRSVQPLGDASGITQYGVNIVQIAPGAQSSLRHYHMLQDEFLMMTDGELVLIDNDGEHVMRPGDCAAFPAGDANGHHLINKSDVPAAFLVVGTRTPTETAFYSDIDMKVKVDADGYDFTRKDGSPLTADQIGDET